MIRRDMPLARRSEIALRIARKLDRSPSVERARAAAGVNDQLHAGEPMVCQVPPSQPLQILLALQTQKICRCRRCRCRSQPAPRGHGRYPLGSDAVAGGPQGGNRRPLDWRMLTFESGRIPKWARRMRKVGSQKPIRLDGGHCCFPFMFRLSSLPCQTRTIPKPFQLKPYHRGSGRHSRAIVRRSP